MSQQDSQDNAPGAVDPTDMAGPSAPVPDTVRRSLFITPAIPVTPSARGAPAAVPVQQSVSATPDISTTLRTSRRTKKTESKRRTRDDSRSTHREPSDRRGGNPRVTQPSRIKDRFERYTSLRVTLVEAPEAARQQCFFPEARPMRPNPGRQYSCTYCRYRCDRGHNTNDCRQLRDEVESLIRRGHLRRCAKDDRGEESTTTSSDQPAERIIGMILGGPGVGADSERARKARARRGAVCSIKRSREEGDDCRMTFGPLDAAGLDADRDDALVITARIPNSEARRVMVDTESFTDVLHETALEQMGAWQVEVLTLRWRPPRLHRHHRSVQGSVTRKSTPPPNSRIKRRPTKASPQWLNDDPVKRSIKPRLRSILSTPG